ncbi:hypothetical protein FQA47_013272 [Oryzias melastigma]|uniref:Uncharacterized protein n=1 Tax=Oryzias melastigma TaxID=30732 RepID=A0A834C490_ORYME|nr:hypothetical protein FQA47_013272 [Oryzias melastigma]
MENILFSYRDVGEHVGVCESKVGGLESLYDPQRGRGDRKNKQTNKHHREPRRWKSLPHSDGGELICRFGLSRRRKQKSTNLLHFIKRPPPPPRATIMLKYQYISSYFRSNKVKKQQKRTQLLMCFSL